LIIEVFAIRHKPTGKYLPSGRGFNGRGMTWSSPVAPSAVRLPRVFHTHKSARISLTYWMKGKIEGQNDDGYAYPGNIRPAPDRVFEDMEIVPITVEIP